MILIFDLDDTLYDEKTFYLSGLKNVSKYLTNEFNLNYKKIFSELKINFLKKGRNSLLENFLKQKKIYNLTNLNKIIKIYRYHQYKIHLYNDAKHFLKHFRDSSMYIITDGNKVVQHSKIKKLSLNRYFKKIFITHRYGIKSAKPSLKCFSIIKKRENVKWSSLVYIGDNPNKDFVNLNKKGSLTIRILRGMYKNKKVSKLYDAQYKYKGYSTGLINLLKKYNKYEKKKN